MKQQAIYKVQGMQKDVSDSSADHQHAYDLHNVRLRHSDTNIITSLVNERGNVKAYDSDGEVVGIKGRVIGFNTLNNTGILFTHEYDNVTYTTVHEAQESVASIASASVLMSASTSTGIDLCEVECDNYTGEVDSDIYIFPISVVEYYNTDKIELVESGYAIHVVLESDSSDFFMTYLSGTITYDEFYIHKIFVDTGEQYDFNLLYEVPDDLDRTVENTFTATITISAESNDDSVTFNPIVLDFTITVPAQSSSDDDDDDDSSESTEIVDTDPYEEETSTSTKDHIYLIEFDDDGYVSAFEYFRGDLGFDPQYPIESTVYFENEKIQKVYWVDGLHQMRYANIADRNVDTNGDETYWTSNIMFDSVPILHLRESVEITRLNTGGMFPSGTVQFAFTYLHRYGAESNIAWISPLYYASPDGRGGAADEVCSCSFELQISNYEVDKRFDYIRLYHIIHTSLDTQVQVRRVADIPIPEADDDDTYPNIVYVDTNTTGETVDPSELLFLGGTSIIPNTLEQKSNTLFLGNLKQDTQYLCDVMSEINPDVAQGTYLEEDNSFLFENTELDSTLQTFSGYYSYTNQLKFNSRQITSFRRGEEYRFGFQAQDKTGKWSDVIWLGDKENTDFFAKIGSDGKLNTVRGKYTLSTELVEGLRDSGYRKVRPVVVYPQPWERNIYFEGLLNPTVYNVKDRASNAPFAQSSWFLRPFPPISLKSFSATDTYGNIVYSETEDDETVQRFDIPYPESHSFVSALGYTSGYWSTMMPYIAIDSAIISHDSFSYDFSNFGSWAEYRHNYPLGDSQQRNGEIQSMYSPRYSYNETSWTEAEWTSRCSWAAYNTVHPFISDYTDDEKRTFINNTADFFYVDQNILTLNSAELEFDETLQNTTLDDSALRITGIVPVQSFISSYDIRTKTPPNKFYTENNDSMKIPSGFYSSEIIGADLNK